MEDAGTDISAIFWKKCQNVQLQKQLDQSHNIANKNNNSGNLINKTKKKTFENIKSSKIIKRKNNEYKLKLLKRSNIDLYFKERKKKKRLIKKKKVMPHYKRFNRKFSQIKFLLIFKYILKIYRSCVRDLRNKKSDNNELVVRRNIKKYLINNNYMSYSRKDKIFQSDMFNIFSYIAHFIDCRKCKIYVRYMLSDGIERIGIILGHPIFPAIPLWIFDVIRLLIKNDQLYLIYSTDTRNVAKWFGHFTSLVNLSNLLYLMIERGNSELNTTLILLHLGGIFTKNLTDPINRQGMKFPCNVLQKTTFENVKNQLLKISKEKKLVDNLSSFISSTIMCVPRGTGTNSFNLML